MELKEDNWVNDQIIISLTETQMKLQLNYSQQVEARETGN